MMLEIVPGRLDLADLTGVPAWEVETGVADAAALLENSTFFDVIADGKKVMTYGLETGRRGGKVVAWVTAGIGHLPGFDLTAAVMPLIEQQLVGADILNVRTMRPGLAKKLEKQGFKTSFILTKELNK